MGRVVCTFEIRLNSKHSSNEKLLNLICQAITAKTVATTLLDIKLKVKWNVELVVLFK